MACDPDFFALRRFDRLHTRSLLALQDRLSALEEKLDTLDRRYSSKSVKIVGANPPEVVDLRGDLPPHLVANRNRDDIYRNEGLRDINNGTVRDDVEERASLVTEITATLREFGK